MSESTPELELDVLKLRIKFVADSIRAQAKNDASAKMMVYQILVYWANQLDPEGADTVPAEPAVQPKVRK